MKRFFIFIIGFVVIVFLISWIHIERTEWVLREKIYDLNIPLKITEETIAEIEEQVEKVVLKEYSNAYLGEIKFKSNSKEDIGSLLEGEFEFIYCKNLGNGNGFYNYDRFVLCEIRVNLKQKLITHMRIYGNNQLGGLEKIEQYPEIKEIRDIIYKYCKNIEKIEKEYAITSCFINILNNNTIMTNFTIVSKNGNSKKIQGIIRQYENEYKFSPMGVK